jgi:hypothetical protein
MSGLPDNDREGPGLVSTWTEGPGMVVRGGTKDGEVRSTSGTTTTQSRDDDVHLVASSRRPGVVGAGTRLAARPAASCGESDGRRSMARSGCSRGVLRKRPRPRRPFGRWRLACPQPYSWSQVKSCSRAYAPPSSAPHSRGMRPLIASACGEVLLSTRALERRQELSTRALDRRRPAQHGRATSTAGGELSVRVVRVVRLGVAHGVWSNGCEPRVVKWV